MASFLSPFGRVVGSQCLGIYQHVAEQVHSEVRLAVTTGVGPVVSGHGCKPRICRARGVRAATALDTDNL